MTTTTTTNTPTSPTTPTSPPTPTIPTIPLLLLLLLLPLLSLRWMQFIIFVSLGAKCWNLESPWLRCISRASWSVLKASYASYQREALGNNLTDNRTGPEIRVMKERLQGLGGRLCWMSSARQFAEGLTECGTRQLLADLLRYGKVKYTWDADSVASKRKGFEERQQRRQEFAQPLRAKQGKVER